MSRSSATCIAGTEKLAESRSYVQIVTLTDRLDYVASMSNNLAYVRAVEKLAGIEAPERAMYLRVITAELQAHCQPHDGHGVPAERHGGLRGRR